MQAPGSVSIRSSWPSFGAVNGWCTAFQRWRVLVVFEHREIDHPQRCPDIVEQAAAAAELAVADLDPQRTERVVDDLRLVGGEEDQVARLRAGALQDLGDRADRAGS